MFGKKKRESVTTVSQPVTPKPETKPISDKGKYLLEIKELVEQLKTVETQWAAMKGLESQREMVMMAIAERKGIIAYLNSKSE